MSGPVSRILSADGSPHLRGDHLSRRTVTRSLQQPTRRLPACEAKPHAPEGTGRAPPRAFPSAWPCSRWGLPGRAGYPARRWSLTPPFHPYGHGGRPWFAVCLCGPVRGSPRPGVTRHRTLWSPDFPRPCSMRCRAATTRPTQAFNVCRHLWYRGVGSRQCQDGAGLPHSVPARQNVTRIPSPCEGFWTLARAPNARMR